MKYIASLLIILIQFQSILAQRQNVLQVMAKSPTTEVSLLTCGPGDQVYTMYGHSAVRVRDRELGQDLVFNYGTFDFETPGFVPKFIRGKLPYSLSLAGFDSFLKTYHREGREIIENQLLLDSLQKNRFLNVLEINFRPENREYLYDFFYDNCSTRIWDLVDSIAQEEMDYKGDLPHLTYRDMIKRYQAPYPWTDFGIDIIIGSPADVYTTVSDQAFLPYYLKEHLSDVNQGGKPILGPDERLLDQRYTPSENSKLLPWMLFAFLLLVEVILLFVGREAQKWLKIYDGIWYFAWGLVGMILLFMWLFTDHQATHKNLNLLWASPMLALLLFKSLRESVWLKILIGLSFLASIIFIVLGSIQAIPTLSLLIISISVLKMLRDWKYGSRASTKPIV